MALTGRITGSAAGLMAAPAMAQNQGGYYGHGHMWDGSGWWMFLGPLWMIVVLGVLIAGVVLLVRWLGGPGSGATLGGGHGHATGNRALDILKERFAKGEIDKAEFEERRKLLE